MTSDIYCSPRQKSILGVFLPENSSSLEIGWQGLLACGNNNYVMVIDPNTVQLVQSLERHKHPVMTVKWSRENYYHDLMSPYTLRLASADTNGQIIVWEVVHATVLAEFSEPGRAIIDMQWIPHQDASHDLLVALHSGNEFILWNADTGIKLWKKVYPELLLGFCLDPFDVKNVVFRGNNCVLMVNDFSLSKQPMSNGRKFYIFNPGNESSYKKDGTDGKKPSKSSQLLKATGKLLKSDLLIKGSEKGPDEIFPSNESRQSECLQLLYHRYCRNHLIFVYPKEILIMDLLIFQTVSTILIEKSSSGFLQVFSCSQRDMLYCLHENGSISVRGRRLDSSTDTSSPGDTEDSSAISIAPSNVVCGDPKSIQTSSSIYELFCQSDSFRLTRQTRLVGLAINPTNEMLAAVGTTDAKIQFWKLRVQKSLSKELQSSADPNSDELSIETSQLVLQMARNPLPPELRMKLSDWLAPFINYSSHQSRRITCDSSSDEVLSLDDCGEPHRSQTQGSTSRLVQHDPGSFECTLKLIMVGLYSGVVPNPTVLRICPPLTRRNISTYRPRLALGNNRGVLQIWDLDYGQLWREYQVLNNSLYGLDWVGSNALIVLARSTPNQSNKVRNEIAHIDIFSGKVTQLREEKEAETPAEFIRVSHLKQYLAIGFKEKPLEIWDIRNFVLLREFPPAFLRPLTLEWSSVGTSRSALKKSLSTTDNLTGISSDPLGNPLSPTGDSNKSFEIPSGIFVRESLIFTDVEGNMLLINVEGSLLKEGSKIPPDSAMNKIGSLAWKSEWMVIGDADGNMVFWNLKSKTSRGLPCQGTGIKKLRFAPGANLFRLLVLHNDGLDIWDTKEFKLVSTIRCPRDIPKPIDVEWSSSDSLALLGQDGVLRIVEVQQLTVACSPMNELELIDPLLNFSILPPKVALTIRHLLQHQPWRSKYDLHCPQLGEGLDKVQARVNKMFSLIDEEGLKSPLEDSSLSIVQRCLITAQLFGDEYECRFWQIVQHHLPADSSSDTRHYLDTNFDVLCDNSTYKNYQLCRLNTLEKKRCTYSQTQKCAESFILLGQLDRAVRLLLETPPDSNNYLLDLHRACLVANTSAACDNAQSTVKLVATNLISNDCLTEGAQLLCMIGKAADACRYLEIYNDWTSAVWLAKCALPSDTASDVMKRWSTYLSSPQINHKSLSVFLLIMLGQHHKVLESLYSMRQFQLAARYLEICLDLELLDNSPEIDSLKKAIFLEYARLMLSLGGREASIYYCNLAGDKGQQLKNEVDFLLS